MKREGYYDYQVRLKDILIKINVWIKKIMFKSVRSTKNPRKDVTSTSLIFCLPMC